MVAINNKIETRIEAVHEKIRNLRREHKNAKRQTNDSYVKMQTTWTAYLEAVERMDEAYENQGICDEQHREVWDLCISIRGRNNARINSFKHQADYEHLAMVEEEKLSKQKYINGDRSAGMTHSQAARVHKERRDKFNAEINTLNQINREALECAKELASLKENSAIMSAKKAAHYAKEHHEQARCEYLSQKENRNRLKERLISLENEEKYLKKKIGRIAMANFNN